MPGLQPSLAESCILSLDLAVLQSVPAKRWFFFCDGLHSWSLLCSYPNADRSPRKSSLTQGDSQRAALGLEAGFRPPLSENGQRAQFLKERGVSMC